MFMSTSAKADRPPVVVNKNPQQTLQESDNIIYAGCYVNASVRLWIQDNKFGKRINSELLGLQFFGDGERFGEGPVDATQEFDNLDDGDTAGLLGDTTLDEFDPADTSLL